MATIVVLFTSLSVYMFTMLFLLQLCTLRRERERERERETVLEETKLRMKRAKYRRGKREAWKMELREKKRKE